MTAEGLLDEHFIRSVLTVDDPWCASHGSGDTSSDLGAGILYYGLAYALKARICVCLGSGGGFVPRLMRKAQRDLGLKDARTFLVDGAQEVEPERKSIWGSPDWLDEGSTFRRNFPDVEILLKLTQNAYDEDFAPAGIRIDYLHIDADHHYDGVRRDWDLYRQLVPDSGLITLHDTTNYRAPCGVPRLIDEIRAAGEFDVVNLPIAYGTAIVRKILSPEGNVAISRPGRDAAQRL